MGDRSVAHRGRWRLSRRGLVLVFHAEDGEGPGGGIHKLKIPRLRLFRGAMGDSGPEENESNREDKGPRNPITLGDSSHRNFRADGNTLSDIVGPRGASPSPANNHKAASQMMPSSAE